MTNDTSAAAPDARGDLPRILLAADGDERAVRVKQALHGEFGARLRTTLEPSEALAEVRRFRPDVLLVAYATPTEAEHLAFALQGPGAVVSPPLVRLIVVDGAALAEAAALCRNGVFDDYVQHFPEPLDPSRLATSVRLACRTVAIARGDDAAVSARAEHVDARPRVLVVEDDDVVCTLIQAMLEPEPLQLCFEKNGLVAFDRIRALRPAIVLMDVRLPGCDGVELTQHLKSAPDLSGIPVVMLTGDARRETLLRSLAAGAADFIVKPFSREALLQKVGKVLGGLH